MIWIWNDGWNKQNCKFSKSIAKESDREREALRKEYTKLCGMMEEGTRLEESNSDRQKLIHICEKQKAPKADYEECNINIISGTTMTRTQLVLNRR